MAWSLLADAQTEVPAIIRMQHARSTESVALVDAAGQPGSLALVNLNPAINSSFLVRLQKPGDGHPQTYHLENVAPRTQSLSLQYVNPGQLRLLTDSSSTPCALWPGDALEQARQSKKPFAPLCDGRLLVRNAVRASSTAVENTTQFLRDHVWKGERIIGFVRRGLYQDAFVERAAPGQSTPAAEAALANHGPPAARLLPAQAHQALLAPGLGIDTGTDGGLLQGRWYGARGLDAVYVSLVRPGSLAAPAGRASGASLPLDAVESSALAYLVAFDLSQLELGFALGTEHPRLAWSARVPQAQQDARLPGPDGFDTAAPLVRTGIVSPPLQPRVVATFSGGFKREHGAFRYGALSQQNHGSHYGFVEQGVVYSSLVPGLSTLYVMRDGQLGMKTWSADDKLLVPLLRHARQNGVPLLERSPSGGAGVFGPLLNAWGPGNWSGSEDEKLRSLRAGACLVDGPVQRYLLYGYFSTATPSAMARVFQAYGCSYAMHLDMNALEHTYLALLLHSDAGLRIEHLVTGMAVLDSGPAAASGPRFLGAPCNRDFFYVLKREEGR